MFAALGVGAWAAAIFHLVTHAFFKGLLFLGRGSVIHGGARRAGHAPDGRPVAKYMPMTAMDVPDRGLAQGRHPAPRRLLLEGRDPGRVVRPRRPDGSSHRRHRRGPDRLLHVPAHGLILGQAALDAVERVHPHESGSSDDDPAGVAGHPTVLARARRRYPAGRLADPRNSSSPVFHPAEGRCASAPRGELCGIDGALIIISPSASPRRRRRRHLARSACSAATGPARDGPARRPKA